MKLFFKTSRNRERGKHKKRRRDWLDHLREWIWPSMGIQAFLRLSEIRIKRYPRNRHRVVLGLAIGIFVSFLPFVGAHLLLVAFLCLLLRGQFIPGVIGTLVGNPWTFPIIWLWTYELGHFILGNKNVAVLPTEFSVTEVWSNLAFFWEMYLWPMTVGGVPTGIVAAVVAYYLVTINMASYQMARSKFLQKRKQERKKRQRFIKHRLQRGRKKAKSKA